MANIYQRPRGRPATLNFDLYEVDGVDLRVDAVYSVSADVHVMLDENTPAVATNGFVDEGDVYSLALTTAEMDAARIVVRVVDQSGTKLWLDKVLIVETTNHPGATHENGVTAAGYVASASSATLQLSAGESAINDQYLGQMITIVEGTGAGQSRACIGYVGATKVATISGTWATNPTTSSFYEIRGDSISEITVPTVAEIRTDLQTEGVDIKSVNSIDVTGVGTSADPWGP